MTRNTELPKPPLAPGDRVRYVGNQVSTYYAEANLGLTGTVTRAIPPDINKIGRSIYVAWDDGHPRGAMFEINLARITHSTHTRWRST